MGDDNLVGRWSLTESNSSQKIQPISTEKDAPFTEALSTFGPKDAIVHFKEG